VTGLVGNYSRVGNLGAGTVSNAYSVVADNPANSGGGTLTNYYGYYQADCTVGDNAYAFYGGLSSGTGKWNCYMAGTAANYFGGSILVGTTALGTGATYNLGLGGGATSPTLGAAAADLVQIAGVDNGAGNRELRVQPESGGYLAFGNNKLRRVPTATRDVEHWTASVNTTDGTLTTLATIPVSANYTYMIEAVVLVRRTGGTAGTADDGGTYHRRASYTTKGGTVTLLGAVQTIGTDAEDQAGFNTTFTISGSNVNLVVLGVANNNLCWFADITARRVNS
jgi:hypothetical protein